MIRPISTETTAGRFRIPRIEIQSTIRLANPPPHATFESVSIVVTYSIGSESSTVCTHVWLKGGFQKRAAFRRTNCQPGVRSLPRSLPYALRGVPSQHMVDRQSLESGRSLSKTLIHPRLSATTKTLLQRAAADPRKANQSAMLVFDTAGSGHLISALLCILMCGGGPCDPGCPPLAGRGIRLPTFSTWDTTASKQVPATAMC